MAKDVIATGEALAMVIESQAKAPVAGDFRANLHVNPDTLAAGAHQTGGRVGSRG